MKDQALPYKSVSLPPCPTPAKLDPGCYDVGHWSRVKQHQGWAPAVPPIPTDISGISLATVFWRGGVSLHRKAAEVIQKSGGLWGVNASERMAKHSMGASFPGWAEGQDQVSKTSWKVPSSSVPFLEPEAAPSNLESCPGDPANPNTLVCVGGPFSARAEFQKGRGGSAAP